MQTSARSMLAPTPRPARCPRLACHSCLPDPSLRVKKSTATLPQASGADKTGVRQAVLPHANTSVYSASLPGMYVAVKRCRPLAPTIVPRLCAVLGQAALCRYLQHARRLHCMQYRQQYALHNSQAVCASSVSCGRACSTAGLQAAHQHLCSTFGSRPQPGIHSTHLAQAPREAAAIVYTPFATGLALRRAGGVMVHTCAQPVVSAQDSSQGRCCPPRLRVLRVHCWCLPLCSPSAGAAGGNGVPSLAGPQPVHRRAHARRQARS